MNWLLMGLKLLPHLPVGKLLNRPPEPGRALNELSRKLHQTQEQTEAADPPVTAESLPTSNSITTEETIAYQKRELGKELLLLEKHFQQQCKINGRACDCCQKHPMAIEALSLEGLGLNGEEIFNEIAQWAKEIAPITTEAASASGMYDKQYPEMAVKARGLRKRLIGSENVADLLSPALTKRVEEKVANIIKETLKE